MLVGKASLETLSRLLGNPGTDILLAFWGVPTSNPIKVEVSAIQQPPPQKKSFKENWIDTFTFVLPSMPMHREQNTSMVLFLTPQQILLSSKSSSLVAAVTTAKEVTGNHVGTRLKEGFFVPRIWGKGTG